MRTSFAVKTLLAAAAIAAPLLADAASTVSTGTGALTATAQVQFQITIPQVLYLRVGTGSAYPGTLATVATVDVINFAPTTAQLASGGAVTGTGGDLTGGVETAAVIGNGGTVTLGASTPGAMNDGAAGDTINWTSITTAAGTYNTATALPAPVLANGASTNITLNATAKTVYEDAKWTYTYNLTAGNVPVAGVYGGATASQNGLVTYTASMP